MNQVKVVVGADKMTFHVPKNLLCARSTFFNAACSEKWSEGPTTLIGLPDDDPALFSIYLQLLYTDRLVTEGDDAVEAGGTQWITLMKAYVLADKLGDTKAANAVLDDILKQLKRCKIGTGPSGIAMQYAYDHTVNVTSPLRKMLVDYCLVRWKGGELLRIAQSMGTKSEFFFEITAKHITRKPLSGVWDATYHVQ